MPTENEKRATAKVPAKSDRNKKVMVAVLLVGLLVAIVSQPASDDSVEPGVISSPAVATPAKPANVTKNDAAPNKATESDEQRFTRLTRVRELSRIEIETLEQTPLLAREKRQTTRETPVTERVQAVYGTTAGHAAVLGNSILRSGAPLSGGRKVIEITTEGVHVSRE